jgi:hypothetical protein
MKNNSSMAPWIMVIALVLALQFSGAFLSMAAEPAGAEAKEESAEDLAKKTQNPVSDMISIPLQNNFNFNYGSQNHIQYVGNIQPVIPIHATENWNVITRTIMPIIYQPQLAPNVGDVWGLGDIQFTAFLSPSKPGGTVWGVGPIVQAPSGTDNTTTSGKWAAGPSAVALRMNGPWVYGALVNYLSSFEGQNDRGAVSQWLIQPFLNYNLPDGWYLTSVPILTANMMAEGSQVWTVPLGGGAGRIVRIGKLPFNLQLQGFYNVVHPDAGPEWSIRFQIQLLLPD